MPPTSGYQRFDGGDDASGGSESRAVPTTGSSLAVAGASTGSAAAPAGQQSGGNLPAPQSQIICSACRTLLVYPQGAQNVRCALCNNITSVPPAGTEMAQLVCGGCRTLLMYIRGATSVQCSQCNTVNLAMQANQIAHINCGGCGVTLMYAYGAQSVKCAMCNFVSQVQAAAAAAAGMLPSSGGPSAGVARTQTVVVENPPSLDENGRQVSNVAVGVLAEE
ncbi:histone demethylase SWIRM1 [Cymbomonas tetramitiformis]|uniref:Histone demethylase SWIRM1 n=1 Tax=Cymbomonas tetramitiformis TaxID=36881 RepID=A0AAE0BDA7_9CHLO|nr:histone demethylase SWIRM1 [Cymbomonas tetramitiformis]